MRKLEKETLHHAAKLNTCLTQCAIAMCMIKNNVGMKDYDKAIGLLKEAEKNGSIMAKVVLGRVYMTEGYANRDESLAEHYFLEAAEKGNVAGMYEYGKYLYRAERSINSAAQGVHWIRKAADLGNDEAQTMLEEEILTDINGSNEQIYEDLLAAADMKDPAVLVWLGRRYLEEAEDYENAFECLNQAMDLGSIDAAYWLGELHHAKESPFCDEEKAQDFHQYAADSGHVKSMEALALTAPKKEYVKRLNIAADLGGKLAFPYKG